MEFRFLDKKLGLLCEGTGDGGYSPGIATKFRMLVWFIRQAKDERDLRAMKSWRFEKLKGTRSHQCSMRLNDQWRLILEFEEVAAGRTVVLVAIEDYH